MLQIMKPKTIQLAFAIFNLFLVFVNAFTFSVSKSIVSLIFLAMSFFLGYRNTVNYFELKEQEKEVKK